MAEIGEAEPTTPTTRFPLVSSTLIVETETDIEF